jgi:tetraacyldisaccharide 4'-kinase
MAYLRILLLPFSWLYGAVLRMRHFAYDQGWVKSTSPELPAIVIGNVALGGTGKTPHVELALRTLMEHGPLATLSRGYGRAGTAFHEVHREDDVRNVGDEPLMLKRKFSGVRVYVGADRVAGLSGIRRDAPELKAVILDDAFQHRKLQGSLNIVLTTWQKPWYKDHLLPAGSLRDLPARASKADAVIVTKCPDPPTADEQHRWRQRLGLRTDQALFFSGLRYALPRSMHDSTLLVPTGLKASAFLVTGIADATALLEHVRGLFGAVEHMAFPDHHVFSEADQARIAKRFATFVGPEKTLITTEKDAARLGTALISGPLEDLPIAVIAVQAEILTEPHLFTALLRAHVATHPANR